MSATATTDAIDNDARHTLTQAEREAVTALKTACDNEGILYNSIFELAKYVLVSHSSAKDDNSKAAKIRLTVALKRIKQRRAWEQKHGMIGKDPMEALRAAFNAEPKFDVADYSEDIEGRNVVAYNCALAPTQYVFANKENLSNFLLAEAWRLDLAAADLEEARQGIALASFLAKDATLTRAFRYLRVLTKAQETLKDMHPNRIRRIYSEVPGFLAHLVNVAKMLLPKKISQRLTVVASMSDFEKNFVDIKPRNVLEWASERRAKYNETVQKVQL